MRGEGKGGRGFLVIVADDFGRSRPINMAVRKAHDSGVLTAASLMTGGEAFMEAVTMAKTRRNLSVGLHLALCNAKAVLPQHIIPDLAGPDGYFRKSPVMAWFRYSSPGILPQIEKEIDAQFKRLLEAGIRPSHVDSHHHLHMHPAVFRVTCAIARKYGLEWIRLSNEPVSLVLGKQSLKRGFMPFAEWPVFKALRLYNLRTARKFGLKCADRVYGLSGTGNLNMQYIERILKFCPENSVNEIFTHPDLSTVSGIHELKTLRSRHLRKRISACGLRLLDYGRLSGTGRTELA